MKWISPLFSDARNKLGGTIYARNRAGVYQRARVQPANPQTAFQQANRAMFSTLVKAWRTLTPAQRLAWNDLAGNSTIVDSLGQTSMPSGFQLYNSRNRNLLLINFPALSAPLPDQAANPAIGTPGPPTINSTAGEINAYFFGSGAAGSGSFTFLFAATPALSAGVSFVAPWLYRTLFYDTDDDNPWDATAAWAVRYGSALAVGTQIGTRVRVIDQQSGSAVQEFFYRTTVTT